VEALSNIMKDYWDDFPCSLRAEGWTAEDFSPAQNLEHVQSMHDFIASHSCKYAAKRSVHEEQFQSSEAVCLSMLQDAIGAVKEFTRHWQLRDLFATALGRALEDPQKGVLHIWSDFMDMNVQ
jgi:hypothetical protein